MNSSPCCRAGGCWRPVPSCPNHRQSAGGGARDLLVLVAALLPLSVAASQPPASGLPTVIAWLQADGLHYGLGGYWDSSEMALESADQVQIRAVDGRHTVNGNRIAFIPGRQHALVDPAKHYANFVYLDLPQLNLRPTVLGVFGKPVPTHIIASWEILVYNKNLLTYLAPPRFADELISADERMSADERIFSRRADVTG